MALKRGDKGSPVQELQRLLAARGARLAVDGDFGPATESAVVAYQRKAGLVVDGRAGPRTLAALRQGTRPDTALRDRDILAAAKRLDVPPAAIRAVCEVESDGSGFMADGRPDVLFERHVFHRRLRAAGLPADQLAARYPNLVNPKRGGYAGGAAEWGRLNTATTIDRATALESASWGLFQIMGYHWQALRYDSVDVFVAAMRQDEGQQLDAFVRFVLAAPLLHRALREQRWAVVARLYNGRAYKANLYDVKLERAFARYQRMAA